MSGLPDSFTPERSGCQVAAVYGWDLLSGHAAFRPESLLADGFELLALDRPAVAMLLDRQVPFQTPEDWLAGVAGDIVEVYAAADSAFSGWTEHHPLTVSSDGLRWPDHDHWNVPETWLAMTVALRLAVAFDRREVTRLRFSSQHAIDCISDRQFPLSSIADLWTRTLPSIVEPINVARYPEPRIVDLLRRKLSNSSLGGPLRAGRSAVSSRRFFNTTQKLLAGVNRSRLVLLLLPARELERSGPIIERLHRHLGSSLIAIPWMDSNELTAAAGELNAVAWLPTPPLERGYLRDERRLSAGVVNNLREHNLGELAPAREEVSAALQLLARGWAAQARRLRWTVQMLRKLQPQLVITARDALAYQVPTEAARIAGVPVITLPHGVVEWSPPDRLEPKPGITHVGGIHNPTAPEDALRVCRDALIHYEYPRRVREFLDDAPGDILRVLILTDGFRGLNVPSIQVRSHQRGLKSVAAAARILGSAARFRLKPHPADPQDEAALMQQDEELDACIDVLPRETDVIAAIAASDLVIGVNYVGSALFHVVSSGRPVVRITTTELPLSPDGKPRTDVTAWAANWDIAWDAFWDRMLLRVDDTDGLVDVLRRMKDPEFVKYLRQRSHDAATALRPDPDAPSIIDVVDEILNGRMAQNN